MTAGEALRLSAASAPVDEVESTDVLTRLQQSALDLLAGLDRAPRSLRIKADQVEIEMEWPEQPAAVAAAPVATLTAVPDVAAAPEAESATRKYLTAQSVGVFYRAPEPGARPFVDVDDTIEPGTQVGIIEAMKLMMAVESDVSGTVVEVLVADGASVEYGDRLLAYEPAGS